MNAPMKLDATVTHADFSNACELAQIDSFVEEQGGTIFQRPAWLQAVEQGTGQRSAGLVARKLDTITGWLPLTAVRSPLFGHALVSSGFAVDGGILASDRDSAAALAQSVQRFAEQSSFSSIELRGGDIPAGWRSWSDKHCGFIGDLAEDDEQQLLAIPRKARAEVRKGLKNELTVTIGRGPEDLEAHYSVYSASVRNLGTPVFPSKLFAAMLKAFPDGSDILTVSMGSKPVSSVLSFYHDGAVLPFWGGGTFEARALRANERMYYELMLHARRKGMRKFDFGRSKTGSGPYKFKKNWGFEPAPLTYGEWAAPGQQVRDIDPTSEGYSRKIELWKKLPLPVANTIGPWIARGLA